MCNLRVLFVDNDLLLNFENCEALRDVGFDVVSTCRAVDARKIISEQAELSALVTDIDLDDDCDGFDLARYARAARPNLPVIYISGTAAARHPSDGVDRSQFVCKPFHPQEVVEALNRAIQL